MRRGLALAWLAACGPHAGAVEGVSNVAAAPSRSELAARGLVAAIAAGDLAGAEGYLADDAACERLRSDLVASCQHLAASSRETVRSMAEVPRGTVTRVERDAGASPDPAIEYWTFDLDGLLAGTIETLDVGGRGYAMLFPYGP